MTGKISIPKGKNVNDCKDSLVQMNIRVKKSVAQSFRSFCEERRVTQSEGLRLLLIGEDFSERDSIMKVYRQEMIEKHDEILILREQNKELLELQKGKESWVLHQRKEWIRIAKAMLGFVINRTTIQHYNYETAMKPLRFKSRWGKRLFHSHQYPTTGDCYEVHISDLVRGLQNKKVNPDHDTPIFVCGKLNDGTPVKFRWYPKKDFIGISPNDERFGSGEGPWLLCCIISKDGAADLVCAVPLSVIGKNEYLLPKKEGIAQSKKYTSSLDSKIAAVNKKLNGY